MTVALGGTFDPVHDGHRALIDRAFELGDVVIGLTTDTFAYRLRGGNRYVRPWSRRHDDLATELERYARRYGCQYAIRPLSSATGIATEPQFTDLVVSPETAQTAERINALRDAEGIPPLEIHVVEHVRDETGAVISSSRIVRGEIDPHGLPLATARER